MNPQEAYLMGVLLVVEKVEADAVALGFNPDASLVRLVACKLRETYTALAAEYEVERRAQQERLELRGLFLVARQRQGGYV
jgi:hypothetical protein